MTKFPETIRICQAEFSVCLGPCPDSGSFETATTPNIIVSQGHSRSLQRVALAHELGHAAAWTLGMAEKEGPEAERFADAFAQALLSLIRDNPELVEWLRELK